MAFLAFFRLAAAFSRTAKVRVSWISTRLMVSVFSSGSSDLIRAWATWLVKSDGETGKEEEVR